MAEFRMIDSQDGSTQKYDTSKPVYAYIRFSTMVQVKKSLQSKKLQDTRMKEKLVRIGFTDIRTMDKDEGISAQKGLDERLDLAEIYKAMKEDNCGGIAAYDASRLWRDRTGVNSADFIQKAREANVPIILHDQTLWPRIDTDRDTLKTLFDAAQKELDATYKRMNKARQEAVLDGSYGGHAIPMGFLVIAEQGVRKYAIYEPHAKLIRWLFKRYRQLNGNLVRLGRELVQTDFHFPDFEQQTLREAGCEVPHVALRHDESGYKLQSRGGLISLFTNRAYLGWYVYNAASEESKVFQGEYINKTAHNAIVDLEDFLFAYSRLSKSTLDGQPNERKPKPVRHKNKARALLEGIITAGSEGVPMYPMTAGDYIARLNNNGWRSDDIVVGIKLLDTAFGNAVIETLETLEESTRATASQSIEAHMKALQVEQAEKAEEFAEQLVKIDKGIRQWELAKRIAMEEESEADIREATANLKKLRADKDSITQLLNSATTEAEKWEECINLLDCSIKNWSKMKFAEQQRFLRVIIQSAVLVEETPHILKLSVQFDRVIPSSFVLYIYRQRGSRARWTDIDDRAIRKFYPQADRSDVLAAVPSRTWQSVVVRASSMGVDRVTGANASGVPDMLAWLDIVFLKSMGLPVEPLAEPLLIITEKMSPDGGSPHQLISTHHFGTDPSRLWSLDYMLSELREIVASL